MKNADSKVVSGVIISGIVGLGALAIFLICRKKENSLDEIGKVICHVGEILESHHAEEPAPIKDHGEKIHTCESNVGAVVDWIASGINLWKKFKH